MGEEVFWLLSLFTFLCFVFQIGYRLHQIIDNIIVLNFDLFKLPIFLLQSLFEFSHLHIFSIICVRLLLLSEGDVCYLADSSYIFLFSILLLHKGSFGGWSIMIGSAGDVALRNRHMFNMNIGSLIR